MPEYAEAIADLDLGVHMRVPDEGRYTTVKNEDLQHWHRFESTGSNIRTKLTKLTLIIFVIHMFLHLFGMIEHYRCSKAPSAIWIDFVGVRKMRERFFHFSFTDANLTQK